jgi:hypothetical protein
MAVIPTICREGIRTWRQITIPNRCCWQEQKNEKQRRYEDNRLRGHSLNFRPHMLSCAGATILSAFGGEVEKAIGDRRGRPTWRSIANNWRRITRLDRPVPLSTAPSFFARVLGSTPRFPPRLEPSIRASNPAGQLRRGFCFRPIQIGRHDTVWCGAQCPGRARHGAQNGPPVRSNARREPRRIHPCVTYFDGPA